MLIKQLRARGINPDTLDNPVAFSIDVDYTNEGTPSPRVSFDLGQLPPLAERTEVPSHLKQAYAAGFEGVMEKGADDTVSMELTQEDIATLKAMIHVMHRRTHKPVYRQTPAEAYEYRQMKNALKTQQKPAR